MNHQKHHFVVYKS